MLERGRELKPRQPDTSKGNKSVDRLVNRCVHNVHIRYCRSI